MIHIKHEPKGQQPFPIAIIVSQFNSEITQELLRGALEQLEITGFKQDQISVIEVPGAVEIPLVAKKIAQKKEVGAIIALGAVIRGETSHYDYVCTQVSNGCQQVMMEYEIPVIFGVLTTENEKQAWDRLGGNHGHKGMDSIKCAIAMQCVLDDLI